MIFKNASIYIEVTDATLTLATVRHVRGSYYFKNIQTQPLNKLDVISGIIFNPTTLFTSILNFVHSIHRVPNRCNAILALPDLNNAHKIPSHYITLQAALCAAKTGLAITQVIPTSLNPSPATPIIKNKPLKKIPNLLQAFQAQNRPPLAWCALGIMLLLTATVLYCIEQIKGPQAAIQAQATHLTNLRMDIEALQKADYKIEPIKKSMHKAQKSITKLQNFPQNNMSAAPLLQAITEHIPDSVMLTTLELGTSKNKKNKRVQHKKDLTQNKKSIPLRQSFPIMLKGLSYDADQIITFNKALGSLKQLRNVRLTHLKRLKSKKIGRKAKKPLFHYAFTLQAIMMP